MSACTRQASNWELTGVLVTVYDGGMKNKMQSQPDVAEVLSRNLQRLVSLRAPISQRDLAAAIQIPTMVWNMAVRGKSTPTLAATIKIANYFQVSLDDLVSRKPPKQRQKPPRKVAS